MHSRSRWRSIVPECLGVSTLQSPSFPLKEGGRGWRTRQEITGEGSNVAVTC